MRLAAVALAAALVPAVSAASAPDQPGGGGVLVRAQIAFSPSAQGVRLVIRRDGRRVFDAPVAPYSRQFDHLQPVSRPGRKPISLLDLDGDREPEVVLDFSWGAAHCCFWSRIYRWDAARRTYRSFRHLWGNALYRFADLERDGYGEFVASDDRFAYEFTSFAESALPLQVWTYRPAGLVDATRSYPALIEADATRQWRAYRGARGRRSVRGVIAAWTAEECLLDRCDEAFETLRGISRTFSRPRGAEAGSAQAYLRHLRAFLRKTGYAR
jgi:hypothetical protein